VLTPLLARALFDPRYHQILDNLVFPHALGLTATASFPTMTALLVATALALRFLETGAWLNATGSGLAAGIAIALEPPAVLFLAGVVTAVALARRFRAALPFLAGLALPVIALGVWRLRGTGHLPLDFWSHPAIHWHGLDQNFVALREYLWSIRLLQWLPIAGAVAVVRRSPPAAGLLGGWLTAAVLLRGGLPSADAGTGTFFASLMSAFPAYLVLAAAVPLLLPTVGMALTRQFPLPRGETRRRGGYLVATGAVLFALVPIVLFAALPRG
jgi:hypothetical protein